LLAQARADGHDIACVTANVADVRRAPGGWALIDERGTPITIGAFVVLALGAPPPADVATHTEAIREHPRYVRNPWTFLRSPDFVTSGDLLIVGTGLTALDVIDAFVRCRGANRIVAVSRRGHFPQPHAERTNAVSGPIDPLAARDIPRSLGELVALVRAALDVARNENVDWRRVLDGIRPRIAELWQHLDVAERRRFLRHVRPFYDPYRHRAPPESLAVAQTLLASGQLRVVAARVVALRSDGDAFEVVLRERGAELPCTVRVAQIINCGGPANDYASGGDPLIANMIRRGDLVPDPIGLGLRALPNGRLLDANDIPHTDLATIGWPMRGTLLEITAVRELRQQAQILAALITSGSDPRSL
jgi:uncharacterized NAD(P)/FAD-binding protein YdhS